VQFVVVENVPARRALEGENQMANDTQTWEMIHAERSVLAETLAGLTGNQWTTPSLCAGWTVHQLAAHILAGAEQTGPKFVRGMVSTGFRFDALMKRDVERLAVLAPEEIIDRLRARTTTTNKAPAPAMAMLGEVVVHGEDLRRPLGLTGSPSIEASRACLEMYRTASFPVGGKKRIHDLRLVATDADWTCGEGPEVSGPATSLLLAMTGRAAGMDGLTGEGASVLGARLASRDKAAT
jgi:uncharacterized protein (TIGR03083 family)